MASWNDLKALVAQRFKVEELDSNHLKMLFETGSENRSQLVLVARQFNESTGEEWVGISSPIGKVGEVPLEAAARMADEVLCGGIVVINDLVCLQHSAPLVNLDTNEFLRPLNIIVVQADKIERVLVGSDRF